MHTDRVKKQIGEAVWSLLLILHLDPGPLAKDASLGHGQVPFIALLTSQGGHCLG